MALSQHMFGSGRTKYFLFTPARIFMQNHRLHAWAEEAKKGLHNRTGGQGKGPSGEETSLLKSQQTCP